MKVLVGALNQEKALLGAFSVIVKTGCGTDGALHSISYMLQHRSHLIAQYQWAIAAPAMNNSGYQESLLIVPLHDILRGSSGTSNLNVPMPNPSFHVCKTGLIAMKFICFVNRKKIYEQIGEKYFTNWKKYFKI